jgi:hypothetical protein
LQNRAWVSRIRLLAVRVALALPLVLVPTLVANPSAEAQTLTVLYKFAGVPDGSTPLAGLIRDAAGNLYGMTVAAAKAALAVGMDAIEDQTLPVVIPPEDAYPAGALCEVPMIMKPEGTPPGAFIAALVCVDPSANWMPLFVPPRIRLPLTVGLALNVFAAVVSAAPCGIGPTGPCGPAGPIGPIGP